MRRVSVVGSAGSGKTTVGRRVAASLDLPFVELDGLFWHRPGWVSRGREDFRAAVAAETAREGWVVDGNYSSAVQDIVWSRADTVVWLDLARAIVMLQIVVRTLGRVVRRRELWNGNRERWRNVLTLDPENSVIAWSWQQYPRRRREYERAVTDPAWRHLRIVRLRSRREVRRFLRDLDGRH